MRMRLEHEHLLDDWRRSSTDDDPDTFVADGPFDFDRWARSARILFLLPGVLDRSGSDAAWSETVARLTIAPVREWGTTHRILARWADWLCPLASRAESFRSAALVHVRKWVCAAENLSLPEFGFGEDDSVWHYLQRDVRFLRDQIEILAPRLIVVAGPWAKLTRIGFFELDEIILDALHYGCGLFREGERHVLAYRMPDGARGAEVRDDLEHVRHVLLAGAAPEHRRALTGRPRRALVLYCAECGQEVMGGAVANAAHWSGATRIVCDECVDAGRGAGRGSD